MNNELFVYRHKTDKDVYLMRDYTCVGGAKASSFYKTTTDFYEAIRNTTPVKKYNHNFEDHLHTPYALETDDTVSLWREKEIEFDGYSGVLSKEFRYHLCDFEKVYFVEAGTAEEGDSE